MTDLYARLAGIGFDRKFVREAILPEWWEDSLAEVPANRALAENLLARHLGLPVRDLSDPSAPLRLPSLSPVKLKRTKNKIDERLAPAILVAQRAARIVVDSASLPPFDPSLDPVSVRQAILRRARFVDFRALLEFCWEHGIVVLHLDRAPSRSKLFDGLAMFCEGRPVVVLGSRRDSPAWHAFFLAHELSHILCRHVTPGGPPLADTDLQSTATDRQEKEADASAFKLLTGSDDPTIHNLTASAVQVALWVARQGPYLGIDPGILIFIYGKASHRWRVAERALKHLSLPNEAQGMIAEAFRKRFHPEELSESSERFLSVLSL